MDIVSHGLWGSLAFGRKNRGVFFWAFIIGILPDILSFGIFWIDTALGFHERPNWQAGPPDPSIIPSYVDSLYNVTHSLVVFLVVFMVIFAIRKKPFWALGAWGLHVLIDIPSHSSQFFPTPFLWPISNYSYDGINWGNPVIFFSNVVLLIALYAIFFYFKKRKKI